VTKGGAKSALPSAPQAEIEVLGACLNAGEPAVLVVCERLRPDDFLDPQHAVIFNVIRRLFNAGAPVEFGTVYEALQADDGWRWGDPAGALTDLMTGQHGVAVETHVETIAARSLARKVIAAGGEITRMAQEAPDDPTGLMEQVQSITHRIINSSSSASVVFSPSEQAEDFMGYLDKVMSDPEAGGLPTGYGDLDEIMALRKGELTIIAARPSTGKTALAECIAERIAGKGKLVVFASLEMSRAQLLARRAARMLRSVPATRFLSGKVPPRSDERFWRDFAKALGQISNSGMWLIDNPRATTATLRADIARARLRAGREPDLVVVDYLQLLKDSVRSDSDNSRIEFISGQMKAIAREFNVPVLSLSQLSRKIEDRRGDERVPRLSDLRGSGAIEQDADVVIFLHRAEKGAERENRTTVRVAKNRNGRIGDAFLTFLPEWVEFQPFHPDSDRLTA
jgi:replicative DNA helicase